MTTYTLTPDQWDELAALAPAAGKIEAIKALREMVDCGLWAAKDAIEHAFFGHPEGRAVIVCADRRVVVPAEAALDILLHPDLRTDADYRRVGRLVLRAEYDDLGALDALVRDLLLALPGVAARVLAEDPSLGAGQHSSVRLAALQPGDVEDSDGTD